MRQSAFPPRALAALAAALLAATVGVSALAAEESSCDRYAVHNLVPGMTAKEVQKEMARRPSAVERVPGPLGPATTMTYTTAAGVSVVVRYDRDAEVFPSARAVSVTARIGSAGRDPIEIAGSLLAMYGDPLLGREELERGLRSGRALWGSGECDAEVEAFREGGSWWDPSSGQIRVEVRGKRVAEATAPGPAPAAGTPAPTPPVPVPGACPAPRLPRLLRGTGLEASVLVRVSVRSDGTVSDAVAIGTDRPGLGLEEAAIGAVRRWRFVAGTRDGIPADAEAEIRVEFR